MLTDGELVGIGMGLGLLQSPDIVERGTRKTMSNIAEFLRSTYVFGSYTNDSIAFQKTVFLLLSPTAPNDDAAAEEHVIFNDTIKTQAKLFELSKKQKKRLREMATLRRDMLNGEVRDLKLMQSYKRKSKSMVNDENKAIVKAWIENGCTKTVPSPNQRDTVVIKNAAGEVISQERVLLYTKSKGELYHEFCKMLAHGGCNLARDQDGLIVVGRTTFEKHLPEGTLKRMSETSNIVLVVSV